jgi:hypothetical protein
MKWRIVVALLGTVVPALAQALADGRVSRAELDELVAALLDAVDVVAGK